MASTDNDDVTFFHQLNLPLVFHQEWVHDYVHLLANTKLSKYLIQNIFIPHNAHYFPKGTQGQP
jgi:hypothetical protein